MNLLNSMWLRPFYEFSILIWMISLNMIFKTKVEENKIKDESIKISAIIPAYNAEKEITKTVKSILQQNYSNFEIIIVNDGSTDKTKEICKQLQESDSRIILYNKKNEGVSVARNYGKEKANGEYIIFIDSDDYIEKNTFYDCVKEIKNNNSIDILKFGYVRQCGKYKKKYEFVTNSQKIILKEDYEKKNIYNNIVATADFYNIWNTMFKKELIKNLTFDVKLKYAEDYYFMVQAVLQSNSIYFIPNPYYHYQINLGSVTQNYNQDTLFKKIEDILEVNNRVLMQLEELNKPVNQEAVRNQITNLINVDFMNIAYKMNYDTYCQLLNKLTDTKNYQKIKNKEMIFKDNEIKLQDKKNFYKNKIKKEMSYVIKRALLVIAN